MKQNEALELIWAEAFIALRLLSRPVGGPTSTLREGSVALKDWFMMKPGGIVVPVIEKYGPSRAVFSLDGWFVSTEKEIMDALEATEERLVSIGWVGQNKIREALILCQRDIRRWSLGLLVTEHMNLHTLCGYKGAIRCKPRA